MLHRLADVKPGQRVLVHGAAGGVGTAVLQLGKLGGLELYGTASKPKHELVRALGAVPIDYKSEDFVERVLALTGDGVDLVLDPIGGSHLARSRKALRRGGMLIAYGASSAVERGFSQIVSGLLRLLLYKLIPDGRSYRLYGIHDLHTIQADLQRLLGLLAEGKLRPVIGARIPLSEAAKAHQLLESAAVTGKIVLVPT
jgi:NADPH:quinone reductase-like Zn-dependent oxidoreductase